MMAEPVVSIEKLTFGYDRNPALEDVNLAIGKGEFVCIIGPNGGGKSTLLKLVLGLLTPKAGQIKVFGKPPSKARSRIGYLPQYAHHDPQFPTTVMEVVLMGRLGKTRGIGPFGLAERKKAIAALNRVGLERLANRSFSAISGGQRQRVLIARALVTEPELLLLDEPTSNIDAASVNEFYDLLAELNQTLTIAVVSHDIGFVSTRVHSVICVNTEVVVHATSELTGEKLRSLYSTDIRLVRHDHRCVDAEHKCPNS